VGLVHEYVVVRNVPCDSYGEKVIQVFICPNLESLANRGYEGINKIGFADNSQIVHVRGKSANDLARFYFEI
jgi:hypothetical protein